MRQVTLTAAIIITDNNKYVLKTAINDTDRGVPIEHITSLNTVNQVEKALRDVIKNLVQ